MPWGLSGEHRKGENTFTRPRLGKDLDNWAQLLQKFFGSQGKDLSFRPWTPSYLHSNSVKRRQKRRTTNPSPNPTHFRTSAFLWPIPAVLGNRSEMSLFATDCWIRLWIFLMLSPLWTKENSTLFQTHEAWARKAYFNLNLSSDLHFAEAAALGLRDRVTTLSKLGRPEIQTNQPNQPFPVQYSAAHTVVFSSLKIK